MSKRRTSKYNLGTITLGDRVRLSDPCYDMNTWCAGTMKNVLPGKYTCKVIKSDEGSWGVRVAELLVIHCDYENANPNIETDFVVGVDSGQAGIFDEHYYIAHDTERDHDYDNVNGWYRRVCDITCSKLGAGTVDGAGVASSSGYGDGWYNAEVAKNDDGKVVGFRISFL